MQPQLMKADAVKPAPEGCSLVCPPDRQVSSRDLAAVYPDPEDLAAIYLAHRDFEVEPQAVFSPARNRDGGPLVRAPCVSPF